MFLSILISFFFGGGRLTRSDQNYYTKLSELSKNINDGYFDFIQLGLKILIGLSENLSFNLLLNHCDRDTTSWRELLFVY